MRFPVNAAPRDAWRTQHAARNRGAMLRAAACRLLPPVAARAPPSGLCASMTWMTPTRDETPMRRPDDRANLGTSTPNAPSVCFPSVSVAATFHESTPRSETHHPGRRTASIRTTRREAAMAGPPVRRMKEKRGTAVWARDGFGATHLEDVRRTKIERLVRVATVPRASLG